jgi:hypothetical protein
MKSKIGKELFAIFMIFFAGYLVWQVFIRKPEKQTDFKTMNEIIYGERK